MCRRVTFAASLPVSSAASSLHAGARVWLQACGVLGNGGATASPPESHLGPAVLGLPGAGV